MTFSIGDVLEQLSDDFPDITVSKIRFLESQGLIAPMRTASGFRMFSDTDITKLKWILLHQRDRFLPLKVIKEYLSSLTDNDFADGNMPNFDFEGSGALNLEGAEVPNRAPENTEKRSHLSSVPSQNDGTGEIATISQIRTNVEQKPAPVRSATSVLQEAPARSKIDARSSKRLSRPAQSVVPYDSVLSYLDTDDLVGATEAMTPRKTKSPKKDSKTDSVLSLEAMTIETGISGPTLKELAKFAILEGTGTGNSIVFHKDEVGLALTIAPLLDRGLEARHIKNYLLFASREVGFLEHIVQDDLRKKNPQAREIAQEKAKQFIQDTARLKELLLLRALRNESQP